MQRNRMDMSELPPPLRHQKKQQQSSTPQSIGAGIEKLQRDILCHQDVSFFKVKSSYVFFFGAPSRSWRTSRLDDIRSL